MEEKTWVCRVRWAGRSGAAVVRLSFRSTSARGRRRPAFQSGQEEPHQLPDRLRFRPRGPDSEHWRRRSLLISPAVEGFPPRESEPDSEGCRSSFQEQRAQSDQIHTLAEPDALVTM